MSSSVRLLAATAATALAAVVLSSCGSNATTATGSTGSAASSTTSTSTAPPASGPNPTIADYIKENDITETGIKTGDPKAPVVKIPVPAGWSAVGKDKTPDYAFEALLFDAPEFAADPPNVVALWSKLTGQVDARRILELAPGELRNLPNFQPTNPGQTGTLGGHPAYTLGGTFVRGGATRSIAQTTIEVPAPDGLYVLQLNVEGPVAAGRVLAAATDEIDRGTTITDPSSS